MDILHSGGQRTEAHRAGYDAVTRDIRWWQIIAVCILIAGVILTFWSAQQQDQSLRDVLLTKTSIAKAGISTEQVTALNGSAADITLPEYKALKVQLEKIRASDPEIRFAYLMGQREDGTVIFYADSEPPESENYSPPGQVYTEATALILTAFSDKEPITGGPDSDRWGTWVSAVVPVNDQETGRLIALFGMDIEAQNWNMVIFRASLPSLIATLLIVLLVLVSAFFQRRSEKEKRRLKKSEEKFSLVFHANPSLMAVSTIEEGRFLDVNSSFLEAFGYSRDEVIGMTSLDLGLFSDPAQRNAIIRQFKETGQVHNVDVKICRKNRGLLDGLFSAILIDDDGVPRMLTVMLDISDRKRAEEALQRSEEKFRLLIENSHDIIYTLTADGVFTFVSPAWTTLLGHEVTQVVGKSFQQFVHPDDLAGCLVFLQNVMETGQRHTGVVYRVQHADGSWRWHTTNAVPLRDESGTIIGFEGSASNITESRLAEEALLQANKKLNLLSSITRHDINNQLTVLQGYLEMLKKKQPDTSLNEYFRRVTTAAQRISAMIRFTKEYEEIGVEAPVWQDIRTLVDTAAKDAPHGQVMVKNDLPAGTEVFADPLIVRVFYNLMDNAVRYGRKITTIRFFVQESGDDHIIVCEDDGDGVLAEEKERIFERGFGKNTGLGLTLSRDILAITGIIIREAGEPGKGARFEMLVPNGSSRINPDTDGGHGGEP